MFIWQSATSGDSTNNAKDISQLSPEEQAKVRQALDKAKQDKASQDISQKAQDALKDSQSSDSTQSKTLAGTQLQGFTPVAEVSSLKKVDLTPGDGATVKSGQTVTVEYTGAVAATGKIFQSSLDTGQPATFSLNQVIAGWTEGIPGMKVGGTRQLVIPANMAYGANPPAGSGIPANAPLVFNVTLLKIGS